MNLPDLYRGPEPQVVDVVAVPSPPPNDRVDFGSLLSSFRRRLWLFLVVALSIFSAAVYLTFTQTPGYTASARVMLDVDRQEVAPTEGQTPSSSNSSEAAIDTEVEVIRSRALASQVAGELGLMSDPDFNSTLVDDAAETGPLQSLQAMIGHLTARAEPETVRQLDNASGTSGSEVEDEVVDTLLGGLSTARVGTTYAIDIFFEGTEPEKAARIANAFATAYTGYNLGQRVTENQQAVGLLSGRIEALRQQAETDTAAVQQYRIANNLLTSSGASLTEQEISAYNQQVTAARAQAAEDVARLNTARAQLRGGSSGDDVGEALGSPVVQSLRSQRAVVSARVADLQGRYLPRHPDILTAQRELSDIDTQIQAEINRVISNLEARARVSQQRMASLQGSLGVARSSLRQNNQAMVQLDELTRKAATSQSLYESYLERLGQTSAAEGTLRAESRVISNARVPLSPSSPNIPLNLALGLLLGLGAGLAAALLAEMMSTSLTTAEDVEQRLGRTYLGAIPTVTSVDGAGSSPVDSIVSFPQSAFAEAFRSLRTSLDLTGEHAAKVVLVTSSLPQEGKTTTSIGLARSAAQQGKRVIIIDGDLRRRGLNRLIKQKTAPSYGLLEVLSGSIPLHQALIRDEDTGLMVLPVAKTQDLTESLTGKAMDDLLDQLRESYDLIIIDAPPVLPIAEARSLAAKADAVVFAVRWRKTPEQAIRTAFRLLPRDKVKMMGVVLTRVDMRKQSRHGYGDPGYYYNQYKSYYA